MSAGTKSSRPVELVLFFPQQRATRGSERLSHRTQATRAGDRAAGLVPVLAPPSGFLSNPGGREPAHRCAALGEGLDKAPQGPPAPGAGATSVGAGATSVGAGLPGAGSAQPPPALRPPVGHSVPPQSPLSCSKPGTRRRGWRPLRPLQINTASVPPTAGLTVTAPAFQSSPGCHLKHRRPEFSSPRLFAGNAGNDPAFWPRGGWRRSCGHAGKVLPTPRPLLSSSLCSLFTYAQGSFHTFKLGGCYFENWAMKRSPNRKNRKTLDEGLASS